MDHEVEVKVKDDEWFMISASWDRKADTFRVNYNGEWIYPQRRFYRLRRFVRRFIRFLGRR